MKSRFILTALAVAVGCLVSPSLTTRAADLTPQRVTPSKTKVLILPSLDQEPMKTVMAPLRIMDMNHDLEAAFLSRQFAVIGPDMTAAVAKNLNVDPSDAGNIKKIAKQTGADWVIGVAITDSSLKQFGQGLLISITLHVNIYDAKQKGWISDKDVVISKNNGSTPLGPMGMYQMGIQSAIDAATAPLVSDYPQTVKLGDVGTNDYLTGQTEPVTGDPNKEFDGLTPFH